MMEFRAVTRLGGAALATFLLLGAAACERDTGDDAMLMDDSPGMAPDAPMADDMMADHAMPEDRAGIALNEVDGSGIRGEAAALHSEGAVRVEVALTGLEPGASYPAHIHRGTCADGGPVAAPLANVEGAEGGSGMASTTLSPDQLPADQDAFIQVHHLDGRPAACGDIRGHGDAT